MTGLSCCKMKLFPEVDVVEMVEIEVCGYIVRYSGDGSIGQCKQWIHLLLLAS